MTSARQAGGSYSLRRVCCREARAVCDRPYPRRPTMARFLVRMVVLALLTVVTAMPSLRAGRTTSRCLPPSQSGENS